MTDRRWPASSGCDESSFDAEAAIGTRIEQLYREHWPLVCGYLLRRTRDPHLAEDLAQETFVKATRALLGWRGESPAAWLLSIARNVLADHFRRSRAELPLPGPEELGAREPVVDALAVRDALDRLPERQRRLLVLVYFDGFSLAEVAAMSGRSVASIKTALWRARAAFADVYGDAS
ncbi:sigma-70 family RNA polymerase sigma factor [Sphaerisporangium sp. TRM90804]|uniref:RNA polymerase sigma factor n=1 Tax=Sphaerisporangium sp. TRM90804 TaxID=3031113 RepID=UPI00244CD28A|nr:sigma-70 family RNA polymerase sigma factor [Sphaerisporangium sp. TRM90804]MDH2428653.1 sigma-70 family RNA polymerase sigma factor [Sphaerisporangium sp. TRM90804]